MDDDLLIGYALDALEPDERAAVEARLASSPEDAARVEQVRQALRPLAADRDSDEPPPGLVVATIARTAEYLVAHGLFPEPASTTDDRPVPATMRPPAEPVFPSSWRRVDVFVAAGIVFMVLGLVISGVGKARQARDVAACQDHLRGLHVALSGYADTNGGRYPEVGSPQVPVAGEFASELVRTGHLATPQPAICPGAISTSDLPVSPAPPETISRVGYAYTLGYVGPNGRVVGLRRDHLSGPAGDGIPVAADLPAVGAAGGPPHRNGQNVLYLGGSVRFATTPAAGVNGDDIYHNDAGLVRAGLHLLDASLGQPPDPP